MPNSGGAQLAFPMGSMKMTRRIPSLSLAGDSPQSPNWPEIFCLHTAARTQEGTPFSKISFFPTILLTGLDRSENEKHHTKKRRHRLSVLHERSADPLRHPGPRLEVPWLPPRHVQHPGALSLTATTQTVHDKLLPITRLRVCALRARAALSRKERTNAHLYGLKSRRVSVSC
jgi:hypothetical protein